MRRVFYFLLLLYGFSLNAQPFKLVKDINTSKWFYNDGGSVSRLAELNGYLYVSIFYPQYGKELWKIDKLSGNKEIVKDIYPGWMGSNTTEIFVYNNFLYYSANDGLGGEELWKSDGTTQGTTLVKDIVPGSVGSSPRNYIVYNNTLIFAADGELWKSDGTQQGTVLIKEIYPGATRSDPGGFCIKDGILYFSASDPQNGRELWRSDGTADSTYMVTDIFPGSDFAGRPNSGAPSPIKIINGYLVFGASDSAHGREVWRSDGTATGTTLLKDFKPGKESSTQLHSSEVFGNKLYFSVTVGGSVELWATDGTPQYTYIIMKLYQTSGSGWINNIVSFKGSLFLRTYASGFGDDIWKSDGTSTGTQEFLQIDPSNINFGIIADDKYLYYVDSKQNGEELWITDGTTSPPRIVKDIEIGSRGSNPTEPQLINGRIYFQAKTSQNGIGIWKSDGSPEGTLSIIESKVGTGDGFPNFLTTMKNEIYFTANDSIHGQELWRSNGTESGTYLLKDFVPGAVSSYPMNFIASDTTLFFAVVNTQLWKTNGTPEGTMRVQPLVNILSEQKMVLLNGLVYFVGSQPGSVRIWKTDGTDAGTVPADELPQYAYPTNVDELVAFKETIFFRGYDVTRGSELWKIEKSSNRAIPVKDIWPGTYSGNPRYFKVAGNYLYFIAGNSGYGDELWRSDGTDAGTIMLEILPGPSSSYPAQLTTVGNEVYFAASDSVHGIELWKSNGTVAGTLMVKDIHAGSANTSIYNLVNLNGTLFFDAYDPGTGIELWKTDGTSAGTVLVKETGLGAYGNGDGPGWTYTYQSFVIDGKLIFTRFNATNGQEPWLSDGTEAGMMMIQDVLPGSGSSIPSNYVVAGDKIYFVANLPGTGLELWAGNIQDVFYPNLQITFIGNLENNNAVLDWQTINERALDKFEIQRSTDGVNFTTLSQSIPKGGLGIQAAYSFTDSNVNRLNKETIYYRLGIRDTAGIYSYSDTVSLTIPNTVTSNSIKVWPIPSPGDLNISIALIESDDINFVLYDLQGRAVKKWSGHFEKGISSKTIHLQVLNAGVYYLSVEGHSLQQLIKVIKM